MDAVPPHEIREIPEDWLKQYERLGIDMKSTVKEKIFWWDRELLALFQEYGVKKFRREAIWDMNWCKLSRKIGLNGSSHVSLQDPRSKFEKLVHRWLKETQTKRGQFNVRLIEKIMRLIGW